VPALELLDRCFIHPGGAIGFIGELGTAGRDLSRQLSPDQSGESRGDQQEGPIEDEEGDLQAVEARLADSDSLRRGISRKSAA
jgi:hypothetical protein